jgi:hypothetical protein
MAELKDLLPQLGEIVAYDLARFETCQQDIFIDYARVFDKLLDVLKAPYPAEEEAAKVIRDYIASRQEPPRQWKSPDWLAYMLGQIVERAKRRPKRHKPLADDELPF